MFHSVHFHTVHFDVACDKNMSSLLSPERGVPVSLVKENVYVVHGGLFSSSISTDI